MLITIYENGNNAQSFQTIFKENLILPKMTTLRLKNAFIGLNHAFIVSEDRTLTIVLNDSLASVQNYVLPKGVYTIKQASDLITAGIQGVINTHFDGNADFSLVYDSEKSGYEIGCMTLSCKCKSLNPNIFNRIAFALATSGFGDNQYRKSSTMEVVGNTAGVDTRILFFGADENSINAISVSDLRSNTGVQVNSWGTQVIGNYDGGANAMLKFWLNKDPNGDDVKPPCNVDGYGALSFKDNQNTKNYYMGLSTDLSSSGALNSIANNTFADFTKLDNMPIMMLVCKQTSGAFLQDSIYFYENATGGGLVEVGKVEGTFIHFHSAGVVCVEGEAPQYYIKGDGATKWVSVGITHGVARYSCTEADALKSTYFQYHISDGTGLADAPVKDIYGSFQSKTNLVNEYGQFIQFSFGTQDLADDFGFTAFNFLKDSSGGNDLAEINATNQSEVQANGDDSGKKQVPYLNVMIDNLPIVSSSVSNTGLNENECSKCLATIPRYDYEGEFATGNNLIYNPTECNTIHLNNAEEISLSQMRFRIQQADGNYPVDLTTPVSFVIEVDTDMPRSHFKM